MYLTNLRAWCKKESKASNWHGPGECGQLAINNENVIDSVELIGS